MVRTALGAAVGLAVLVFAAQASADIVYWGNQGNNTISFAALDGARTGDLNTTGAVVTTPDGTALDPAHNKIYWASGAGKISSANLDGSGAGAILNTAGAKISDPVGLALDPTAGRIYWANEEDGNNAIAFANLDGSGGGNLNTAGATLLDPAGVAVDPAAGRIYWTNNGPNKSGISYARLDGSGGADLVLSPSPGNAAGAVAVDPLNQRAWWTNLSGSKISSIGLTGAGASALATSATIASPIGVALDPGAGRLYWANASTAAGGIAFANFDGSAPGGVNTGTATVRVPVFPAVLKPPAGTAPPTVSGGRTASSKLTCSGAQWAGDLNPAQLYQAPSSVAYAWTFNGRKVKGAKTATLRADGEGRYRCTATATNPAGSATQTSPSLKVPRGHRRG